MYEDFVKRLRERAAWINFPHHGEEYPTEDAKLMMGAADAIEELSRLADAIPHVCECCIGCEVESGGCDHAFVLSPKRAKEYLGKPRWIPVTERLPEPGERVLVTNGGGFVCESFLAQNGKWQRGGVDMFFMTPAYWMPLPQPPTECRKMVTDSNQLIGDSEQLGEPVSKSYKLEEGE